jgi:hypothetical protein
VQRNFQRTSAFFIAIILFFNSGCTKIDTTTLGSDLIPEVDNIHTFADTLDITTSQGFFADTSRVVYNEYHPLGSITNDPVFGKTNADLYLQLKPGFFPYFFGVTGDTINPVLNPNTGFDSAVLCLSYKTFYGDTLMPQTFTVYEINSSTTNFKDSSYRLDFLPDGGLGAVIGQVTILPTDVKKYIYFKGSRKDSINNQIRIPLSDAYLRNTLLVNLDTSSTSTGIYRSDSLYKTKIKGYAIVASGGQANGLFYVDVSEAATRLEVHYRKVRNTVIDTTFSTFNFSLGFPNTFSAQATHLERNWNGAELQIPSSDALYLQTTPGTYATLNIPGIDAYDNRIIHRAEIVVEGIPGASMVDDVMLPPSYLYLDLVDTPSSAKRYKPVYFDLNPDAFYNPDDSLFFYPNAGISFNYFGGYLRKKTVGAVSNYYYTFNVSRYLQHIVTNHLPNYSFRLTAPNKLRYYGFAISYNNLLANGRIKIGSGTNPNYKMYMRVVYSKL